jgi:protein tyrosine phosphatase (PTP) superfamily phosphohydrolase (DUF442 family)
MNLVIAAVLRRCEEANSMASSSVILDRLLQAAFVVAERTSSVLPYRVLRLVACSALVFAGCEQRNSASPTAKAPPIVSATSAESPTATTTAASRTTEAEPAGLHNLMQVTQRIYSGSEPHGEEGIASVQKLGVKTIVSVDGAKPAVETARKYGMRYVHIPIGYDGVPEEAGQSLARLVREAESPIYVHCHHGKHRGPAAAAVACIASGDMTGKEALAILVRAGTSKDYAGLWRDVEAYTPPPAGAELPELVEVAEVGSFTAAMAQVDRAFDNLKLCRDVKWTVPPDHPDLVPAQEALLLQEGLHEAARNLGDEYDEQFKAQLAEAEALAIELRSALQTQDVAAATERSVRIEQSCKQCHTQYRDQ